MTSGHFLDIHSASGNVNVTLITTLQWEIASKVVQPPLGLRCQSGERLVCTADDRNKRSALTEVIRLLVFTRTGFA